jgi:haloalkane dehalogenase
MTAVKTAFQPKKLTNAPLQITVSRQIRHSAMQIWPVLADHEGMTTWMPGIKHVDVKHNGVNDDRGLHCERECTFGNDLLREKIVHWNPPYGYAYMIADGSLAFVSGHLGHIDVEPNEQGARVTWRQYFRPKGLKGWMMKRVMMPQIMKMALKKLERKAAKSLAILMWLLTFGLSFGVFAQPLEKNIRPEVSIPAKQIPVLDAHISYLEIGTGADVLFLHGLPTSSYLWRNVLPIVGEAHHAVAIDLIGFGASGQPAAFDLATQYRYLEAYIETAGLRDIVLVVNDLGSVLGLMYAARHPENVQRIVYAEALFMPIEQWFRQLTFFQKTMFAMMKSEKRATKWFVKHNRMVNIMIPYGTKNKLSKEQMEIYRQAFADQARREIFVHGPGPHQMALSKKSGFTDATSTAVNAYAEKLTQLNIPMLLLQAKPGMIVQKEAIEYAQKYFKNLETVQLGKGKHFLPEDQPTRMAEAINNWLANH